MLTAVRLWASSTTWLYAQLSPRFCHVCNELLVVSVNLWKLCQKRKLFIELIIPVLFVFKCKSFYDGRRIAQIGFTSEIMNFHLLLSYFAESINYKMWYSLLYIHTFVCWKIKEENKKDGGMILLSILVGVLLFIWFIVLKYPFQKWKLVIDPCSVCF